MAGSLHWQTMHVLRVDGEMVANSTQSSSFGHYHVHHSIVCTAVKQLQI